MKRMLAVIAVFGSICLAGSAVAQGPGGPGGFNKKFGLEASGASSIQKLEHQVEQLRLQILDLEMYLKHSKSGSAKTAKGYGRGWSGFEKRGYGSSWAKGPSGYRGFDKKGYGSWWGKGPGGPGFDKKGPKGFGPPAGKGAGGPSFEKKAFGPSGGGFDKKAFNPPAAASKAATTQERLDQIIREIGELRRALKKQ